MVDSASSPMDLASLKEQLDDFLAHVRRDTGVPGVAAAVSVEGTRLHSSAGVVALDRNEPFAADTGFHLGCITKLFVSIITLELAARGRLELAAPIQEYLPELRGTVHGETVTPAHLLSHTSGYRGTSIFDPETLSMSWDDLVERLRSSPQHFTPGAVYSYEHTETVIAGEILRRVTGKTSMGLVHESIYVPLGIYPATIAFEAAGDGRHAGQHVLDASTRRFKQVTWSDLATASQAGFPSMWESAFSRNALSLEALLTIAEYLMGQTQRFSEHAAAPLAPATLSLLQRPAVELVPMVSGPLAEVLPATFGLGAAHWRDGFYGIAGSTYGQCQGFRFDARTGIAVAVGVNALQRYLRDLVIGRICEALGDGDGGTPPRAPMPFELDELAGEYNGMHNQRATASVDDDRLVLVFESGASALKMRAELIRDDEGGVILHSPTPELSLGFFRAAERDDFGLMVGTTAYKRVAAA